MNRLALLLLCTLTFSLIALVDGKEEQPCKKPKDLKGAVPFTVYEPVGFDTTSLTLTNRSAYCDNCTNGFYKGWFGYAEGPIDPENTENDDPSTAGFFSCTICANMSQLCLKGKLGKKTVYYTLQDTDRLGACEYSSENGAIAQ